MESTMTRSRTPYLLGTALLLVATGAGTALAQSTSGTTTPPATQATPQTCPGGGHVHGAAGGAGQGCMGGMHHGMHQGGMGRMHGGHGGRGGHAGHGMSRLDTDRDGAVSRAEFEQAQQAGAQRRLQAFDTADADKDGKVTTAEWQAFREQMRAQAGVQGGAAQRGRMRGGQAAPQGAPGLPATPRPAEAAPGA
jgi:hypothetical protein